MFVEESREKEWTDYNTIWFMQSFVQSFPYKSDDMTTRYDDYPRYPAETIVDGGDCEDSAILLAALVRKLNHGVALLLFREDAHMAVGVEVDEDFADNWSLPYELTYYTDDDGQMYAYCETTAEGWGFGEKPPDIESSPDISVVN